MGLNYNGKHLFKGWGSNPFQSSKYLGFNLGGLI